MTIETKLNSYIVPAGKAIPNDHYIVAVVDGTGFTEEVKPHFKKPYDPLFEDIMNATAREMMARTQIRMAYVKSDEIVALIPAKAPYFGRDPAELAQRLSAKATRYFMDACTKHHKPLSAEFHATICDVPTAKEVEEVFIERQLDHFINQLNGYAHAHGIARTKREQVMAELEKHYPQEGWRTYGTLVYRVFAEVDGHNPKTKQDTRTMRKQVRVEKNLRLFRDKKPDLHPLIVHPAVSPDVVTGHR